MTPGLRDYPWYYPPPGFEPLDLNGSLAIPTGQTVQAFAPYTIPLQQEGWITQAGIELSSYGAGTFFTLLMDNKPIRNYEQVTVPLGAPNTPAILYIRLRPNQPFVLQITNATGGTLASRWRFYGWYYPLNGKQGI